MGVVLGDDGFRVRRRVFVDVLDGFADVGDDLAGDDRGEILGVVVLLGRGLRLRHQRQRFGAAANLDASGDQHLRQRRQLSSGDAACHHD